MHLVQYVRYVTTIVPNEVSVSESVCSETRILFLVMWPYLEDVGHPNEQHAVFKHFSSFRPENVCQDGVQKSLLRYAEPSEPWAKISPHCTSIEFGVCA